LLKIEIKKLGIQIYGVKMFNEYYRI